MKMLWMLMAMTATTQYVSAQVISFSTENFIHIKQKKAINVDNVCTEFDSSILTWGHPLTGQSPVSIAYENLWDTKSVKMTITMKPGYRPQLYDNLYHFIQISPTETYTRFETSVDTNVHLTSAEMTMLYSDLNFAAKSEALEQYCRLQIPTTVISQNSGGSGGTLTFEQTVSLDFLKTCAEQKFSLILHRTANDETERCRYVTHPSTKLTQCGSQITGNAAATAATAATTAVECMKACDGYGDLTESCNAFTFDTLADSGAACKLYPGTGQNLLNGNFDVSNTATNPNCKLAVPDAGTDMTAYLLDPHTIQGKCYQYVYDGSGTLPSSRRLAASSARQLASPGLGIPQGRYPAATCPSTPSTGNAAGFAFGHDNCQPYYLREIDMKHINGLSTATQYENNCKFLCAHDPYCKYAIYFTNDQKCRHFAHGAEATGACPVSTTFAGKGTKHTLDDVCGTEYTLEGPDSEGLYSGDVVAAASASAECTAAHFIRYDDSLRDDQCGTPTNLGVKTLAECALACMKNINPNDNSAISCNAFRYNPPPINPTTSNGDCIFITGSGLFDGTVSGANGGKTSCSAVSGADTNMRFYQKIPWYIQNTNNECFPTISGYTGPTSAPTTAPPTVPGATSAPTIAATNAPTVPPVAGGQSGATNAPTPAQTPGWHTGQQYDDSLLQIDFVVTSVQCKCPETSSVGSDLEHCDVPFYQKVTFTRTEDADHTAETGTLIISDSNLYLLPEQDVLVKNVLEEISVSDTAFNFGSATIGIDDPNACKPEVSITSEYVNCGGTNAFVKPYQREEQMTISFKSTSALQMQTVTLKTFDDPDMSADESTDCVLTNGIEGTYGANSKKCTVESFSAPIDVYWEYATPAQDNGNSPSRAYSFTFDGDQDNGPLSKAYAYYADATLVLNVIVETTVSQAGARPLARRRLGAASSIQLVDDGSRSLRLLSEDSSVETVVLSLPVLPMMDGGGGGLGGLSVGSSNSTNGTTVLTIPQTIVNQYHTTHNDGESAGTISLVLSAVAVTLVVSGMAVWGIRQYRSSKGRNNGASSSSNRKVSSESESYGERTPMLSMRGLHVA